MAYPHKWSPIGYRSSEGQQKHIGQRLTLYRWTTQPTSVVSSEANSPHPCKTRRCLVYTHPSAETFLSIYKQNNCLQFVFLPPIYGMLNTAFYYEAASQYYVCRCAYCYRPSSVVWQSVGTSILEGCIVSKERSQM